MKAQENILVTGSRGLIGGGVVEALGKMGMRNILAPSRQELDLKDARAVEGYFALHKPDYVFLLAGVAGGIARNSLHGAEMMHDNLAIQINTIRIAYEYRVRKLLFAGSACSYPRDCFQPISPRSLMTGPLEPSSEPFAIAKIAGMKMCQAYRSLGCNFVCAIPTTCYGPGDHFNDNGHVISSMIHRMHVAKINNRDSVEIWGTGRVKREFIYRDDLANALVMLMNKYDEGEIVNVGSGNDISIADLAQLVKEVVGFPGELVFDRNKPDGMPRRLLDSSTMTQLGFRAKTPLRTGIQKTYDWYVQNRSLPDTGSSGSRMRRPPRRCGREKW